MNLRRLHTIWNWCNLTLLLGFVVLLLGGPFVGGQLGPWITLALPWIAGCSGLLFLVVETMNRSVFHALLTAAVILIGPPLTLDFYPIAWLLMRGALRKRHEANGLPGGSFYWPSADDQKRLAVNRVA
jgi:hypothetical protein